MNENEKLLSVRGLTINYETDDGVVSAVDDMSFELGRGEALGLVGETGAGKTTTALGLMGLVPNPPGRVAGGEIFLNGCDILKQSPRAQRALRGKDLSMIFQDPMTALNPVMTIGEQVAEVIRLHERVSKAEAHQKAADMLKAVGLMEDRMSEYPHRFSGGMRQRVVIAMALACSPQLLIADEPTTALDVTIQAQVLGLMNELRKKHNTAMLFITHDLGVVTEICDRVAIMYAGQIVETGSLKEIYEQTRHPYTKGLFGSLPRLSAKTRRLSPIRGLMPDPLELPAGCRFHPRCPQCRPECSQKAPPNTEVSRGHFVRCLLYENGGLPEQGL